MNKTTIIKHHLTDIDININIINVIINIIIVIIIDITIIIITTIKTSTMITIIIVIIITTTIIIIIATLTFKPPESYLAAFLVCSEGHSALPVVGEVVARCPPGRLWEVGFRFFELIF